MKEVKVICPKCGQTIHFKNWFHWVWHCPFHWFGKRRVKCPHCNGKSWAAKRKRIFWQTIFATSEYTVEYDKKNKMYRVSWFEDGHFVNECKFTSKH